MCHRQTSDVDRYEGNDGHNADADEEDKESHAKVESMHDMDAWRNCTR